MPPREVLTKQDGTEVEAEDENIVKLPDRIGKQTMIGKLREHMHIQVGADPNDPDSFIHGPFDVPLTPKIARAHLTKFSNVREIKQWLHDVHGQKDMKPGPPRLTPQQRFDKVVEESARINRARAGTQGSVAGPSRAEIAEIAAEAAGKAAAAAVEAAVPSIIDAVTKQLRAPAPPSPRGSGNRLARRASG